MSQHIAEAIELKRTDLEALCHRYRVRVLEVFGSATTGEFDPNRSDIDFLVQFESGSPLEHYERYFGLREDLADLFGRSIDLIEPATLRNPYLIRRINESRRLVYAA